MTALRFFLPVIACIIVLLSGEILLRSFNDFGLVYPYIEFFTNKYSRESIHKGDLWGPAEFSNIIIRDANFQHTRPIPDLSNENKIVYLLGDSMVESVSTPLDLSFHGIVDNRHPEYCIIAQHYAGCSLDTLSILLNAYPQKLTQNGKIYKPQIAIAQLRGLSYQGGNTSFFDPQLGRNVDYQAKLNDREEHEIVKLKQNILNQVKFDVKFSDKFKDKVLRTAVLGDSHILSLIAWKFYNWSISQAVPNNEDLLVHNTEDDYWRRFENSLIQFIQVANYHHIQPRILLIPDWRWFNHYKHSHQYNEIEQRYISLFDKYRIPYVYAMEDIYQESLVNPNPMFWHDGHPSGEGSKAIARSLERLIGGAQ